MFLALEHSVAGPTGPMSPRTCQNKIRLENVKKRELAVGFILVLVKWQRDNGPVKVLDLWSWLGLADYRPCVCCGQHVKWVSHGSLVWAWP